MSNCGHQSSHRPLIRDFFFLFLKLGFIKGGPEITFIMLKGCGTSASGISVSGESTGSGGISRDTPAAAEFLKAKVASHSRLVLPSTEQPKPVSRAGGSQQASTRALPGRTAP